VGYVARAHGIGGELAVRTFDPESTALLEVERVRLKLKDGTERAAELTEVRRANQWILVTLAGVSSRTGAEALVGSTVLVARADLTPPAEGEFFQGDLVGLTAVDEAGTALGTVAEVWNTGPVPNLVIRGGAEELIVPFADAFVPTVDLAGGRIVVKKPELFE
jgi:16S rRNA processing protein RimM